MLAAAWGTWLSIGVAGFLAAYIVLRVAGRSRDDS